MKRPVESTSVIVLVSHVVRNDWAAILPVRAAEIFLKGDDLGSVPIVDPDARHIVGLVARHREPFTPELEVLLGVVLGALLDRAKSIAQLDGVG